MNVAVCTNGLLATRAIQVYDYDMAAFSNNGFTIVLAKSNFPVRASIARAVTVGPPYSEFPYDTYLVPRTSVDDLSSALKSNPGCTVDDQRLKPVGRVAQG
ncbi:hypothetical protein C4564_01380 [Candidatus Microgenomates bacterium]|nr:MAG: hypothetical protein C4564_01380 [Candidatus Microgenomates bacterium]